MNPQELHVIQALEKANATEHLTAREKHLIGLAVTITRGCTHCTGGRIEKALQSDITQDTLTATADLVAAVNAESPYAQSCKAWKDSPVMDPNVPPEYHN